METLTLTNTTKPQGKKARAIHLDNLKLECSMSKDEDLQKQFNKYDNLADFDSRQIVENEMNKRGLTPTED